MQDEAAGALPAEGRDGVGVELTPRRHDDCDLTVSLDVIQVVFDETQTETQTKFKLQAVFLLLLLQRCALGRIRNVPS